MSLRVVGLLLSVVGLIFSFTALLVRCSNLPSEDGQRPLTPGDTVEQVAEEFLEEIGYPPEMEAHCADNTNFTYFSCMAWLNGQPQFSFICDDNLIRLSGDDYRSCSLIWDLRPAQ